MRLLSIYSLLFCLIFLPVSAQKKSKTPQEIDALYQHSGRLLQQNKFAEALSDLNILAQYLPKNFIVFHNRSVAHLNLNNLGAAIADATIAISIDKKHPGIYLMRGLAYLRSKQSEAALADFKQFIVFNPRDYAVYYNSALALLQQNRLREALPYLDTCIKLNPTFVDALNSRAIIKNQFGDPTIERDFKEMIRLQPTMYEAYHNLGQLYLQQNRYAEARGMMQKKIQLRPYEILNQILLGFIEIQTGNYTESISTFSEVLNRDSTNIKALSYRAFARYRAKQYAKAIADCDTFFRYNPEDISRTMNGNLLDMSAASAVAGIQTLTHSQMYPLRALSRRKLGDKSWHSDIRKALLLGQTNEQVRELIDTAEKAEAIFYDITKERVLFPQAWQFPEHYQLYARDHNDSARVPLQGIILRLGYDSVYVRTYKNGALLHRSAQILAYNASSQATFSLQTSIHAEKSIYRFEVGVKNKTQDTILAMRDSILCGDAFMMNGQSNVVYGSAWKPQENQYFRTFSLNIDDHFWNIPPSENNTLANALMENIVKVSSVPVAIINGGLGGTKIETHLPRTLHSEPSSLYGRLNTYATAANLAKTAKAMIWYQGEANTADDYGQKFDTLRTAWKQDYPSINKVYVVQIRPSECGQATQDALREIQRNFGTKYPDVEVIAASGLPAHDGCHYRNDGYITLGKQLFNLINRDFYKATDTLGISSPNLVKAAWTGAKRDEIALTFASNDALVCGSDTSVAGKVRTLANDAFLLDGKPAKAVSVRSEKNVVLVKLSSASGAKTISYIPEKCYVASGDVPCVVYEGPWITTSRGVGALTFANIMITAP